MWRAQIRNELVLCQNAAVRSGPGIIQFNSRRPLTRGVCKRRSVRGRRAWKWNNKHARVRAPKGCPALFDSCYYVAPDNIYLHANTRRVSSCGNSSWRAGTEGFKGTKGCQLIRWIIARFRAGMPCVSKIPTEDTRKNVWCFIRFSYCCFLSFTQQPRPALSR